MSQKLESEVLATEGPQRKLRSRRSPLEVRMDILAVLRDGAEGPTQIMYRANLSWIAVTQHLNDLVGHAILSEHNIKNRVTYELTERGINILKSYRLVVDEFNLDRGGRHRGL